jgi:hypothetical protein
MSASGRRVSHEEGEIGNLDVVSSPSSGWTFHRRPRARRQSFVLADHRCCYPLTVTDFASRFLLTCETCGDHQGQAVGDTGGPNRKGDARDRE